MARNHPDELSADFRRLYGVDDWRTLPPLTAASWCAAMLGHAESWTHRALNPEWRWADPALEVAAETRDLLSLLWWAKTKDAEKGRNVPKPFPRPGTKGYHTPGGAGVAKGDTVSVGLDEIDALLAAYEAQP